MAGGTGTAEIDFGTHPGLNETSVTVTGLTGITSAAFCEAWFMATTATTDHTTADHKYAPTFIALTCSDIVAGTGFTINARSHEKMTGKFNVSYVWQVEE